jgi:hypothetical protein
MPNPPFVSTSKALSQAGIDAAASSLGVGTSEIWTVLSVEPAGCGFLSDRRPRMLFERHYFHRLTAGRFDDGNISDPAAGGYGPTGPHQYDRLAHAIALDRTAALSSASWGLGQIMGENFKTAGFPDAETMVAAMSASEDAQLAAMSSFVRAQSAMANALKTHDWATFARHYNGSQYAQNAYDKKLSQAFAAHRPPDLNIRAAQLYLTFAGFDPGPVDGIMGAKLSAALAKMGETVDSVLLRLTPV